MSCACRLSFPVRMKLEVELSESEAGALMKDSSLSQPAALRGLRVCGGVSTQVCHCSCFGQRHLRNRIIMQGIPPERLKLKLNNGKTTFAPWI